MLLAISQKMSLRRGQRHSKPWLVRDHLVPMCVGAAYVKGPSAAESEGGGGLEAAERPRPAASLSCSACPFQRAVLQSNWLQSTLSVCTRPHRQDMRQGFVEASVMCSAPKPYPICADLASCIHSPKGICTFKAELFQQCMMRI